VTGLNVWLLYESSSLEKVTSSNRRNCTCKISLIISYSCWNIHFSSV